MNRRLFLLISVLLFHVSLFAQGEMFVGYDSFCGLPVVVGHDAQTASARKDQFGNKYIHIDPSAMSNWTMSRLFTLAHECAHHYLGHTTQLGELERFRGGTAKQELEADCWAARKLREIGLDFDINRTILQYASQGHFSAGGYPSGSQRAKNILDCIGGGQRLPCRHKAHPGGDRVPCKHVVVQAHPRGDVYPCQHICYGPYGAARCHPMGDVARCQHFVKPHQFDLVSCQHKAHPGGCSGY